MKIKLKLLLDQNTEESAKNHIIWIEQNSSIEKDLRELFKFFGENIAVSRTRRIHKYYRIKSPNLAILISVISTILEIIPESVVLE